ncbi:MAG: ABC transporter ATP-binding protein, partial [Candidatus Niyogibacteria bacterium]|nr:ABC transporter ATP-binding protein [Candidatus Niyogibacteria bacterium]
SFLSGSGQPTDIISQSISSLFAFFDIRFAFRNVLLFIVALFFTRAVTLSIFGYIRGYIIADFSSIESRTLLARVMNASWPFLLQQKLGHVQTSLMRDVKNTSGLLGALSQLIQSITGVVIYLIVALNISPLLTLCTAVGGAVLLGIVRPLMLKNQRMAEETSETEKTLSQFISEHIIGIKTVKAGGVAKSALAAGSELIDNLRRLSIRSGLIISLSGSLFQPFSLLFIIGLFSILYLTSSFNLVSFAAALYLIQKIFTYLESAQSSLQGVITLLPYARGLQEFKSALGEHKEDKTSGENNFSFNKELRFDHVSFTHEGREAGLYDLSFRVYRGETVGLIGHSGSGKTTVADLVLRLFRPTAGHITLDGVEADNIKLDEWRENIGYVSQDIFLINGTIAENIRFYGDKLSDDDVERAARQANIYDFVMSLPEGFNSMVGERGVLLSGGQRQRIALARALVRKPDILILDEATSALDTESENLIHKALNNLHSSITMLIIAHRLSTVANADRIFTLEDGRIIEEGTPAELSVDPNSYFSRHGGK